MMNKSVRFLFLAISLFMVYLATVTSIKSDMFHLPQPVLNEPWFWTTLVDFYFNILVISCWVIYKEANWLWSLLWIAAFVALGSIATTFYVFLQISKLKEGEGLAAVLIRRAQ